MMTPDELTQAWVLDNLMDAEFAEKQAVEGPFFPERGITTESLLEYAAECRRKAERPNTTLLQELRTSGGFPETMAHWILNQD